MEKKNLKTGTCIFGHKWTMWEYDTMITHKYIDGEKLQGSYAIQRRTCVKCGKIVIERLTY